MLSESLIFFILLLFINLIFIFRQVPLVAFPIGLFSYFMGATVFLIDTDIPSNPHSTVFFMLIITCSLLSNVLSFGEKKGK